MVLIFLTQSFIGVNIFANFRKTQVHQIDCQFPNTASNSLTCSTTMPTLADPAVVPRNGCFTSAHLTRIAYTSVYHAIYPTGANSLEGKMVVVTGVSQGIAA
jgi:hypothetical protein